MGNCNNCVVESCKKFIRINNDCRNYLAPEPFKRSILEHLTVKDATKVAQLLAIADVKFDETHEHPFFRLLY